MPDRIPISINPEHAATRGYKTSGVLKLESMVRLIERLVAPFGEVRVSLKFGKDGRRMFLQGNITGSAILQCQRCLQDIEQTIDHSFKLVFIYSEAEIEGLSPGCEPLLIDDNNNKDLRLAEVIEDELELLLPMVVMHSDELCKPLVQKNTDQDIETELDTKQVEMKTSKKNPFNVLRDLKKH